MFIGLCHGEGEMTRIAFHSFPNRLNSSSHLSSKRKEHWRRMKKSIWFTLVPFSQFLPSAISNEPQFLCLRRLSQVSATHQAMCCIVIYTCVLGWSLVWIRSNQLPALEVPVAHRASTRPECLKAFLVERSWSFRLTSGAMWHPQMQQNCLR